MSECLTMYICFSFFFFYIWKQLCEASGSSLGYGFNKMMSKAKSQSSDSLDDNQISEGTLAI